LEDEALRGDLEDAAWQPIQDWAIERIADLARRANGLDDDEAVLMLESAYRSLRKVTVTLADLAALEPRSTEATERLEALRAALTPPLVDVGVGSRLVDLAAEAVASLQEEQATSANIASRLVSALRGPVPTEDAP
jgi:hypothetical protein